MIGKDYIETTAAQVTAELLRLGFGPGERVSISIFGPEWPDFNPMVVLSNRVVDEWTDRLAEVPTVRDDLPVDRAEE
jgi:hypothetical protein